MVSLQPQMSCGPYLIFKLIFTAFTALLYDLLLYIIFRGRNNHFKSAFFALFIATGIADMLYLWHRVFATQLPILLFASQWINWATEFPVATIINSFEWYISYVQILGIISISINRLFAIASPIRYNTFWTKRTVQLIIFAQWILPILVIIPMFTPCCHSIYEDGDIELLQLEYDDANSAYSLLDSIFEILLCMPTIIFLNIFTVVASVRDRKQRSVPGSEAARKRAELRLAIVNSVSSISFVAYNTFSFLWWMGTLKLLTVDVDSMSNWYYNFADVFTLCNPYLILFISTNVRDGCISFVTCNRFGPKASVGIIHAPHAGAVAAIVRARSI